MFCISWFAFCSAFVHHTRRCFTDVCYSKCTPQGCRLAVKRAVLLWPLVFRTVHADPTLCSQPQGVLENYFLTKNHVCLFWWFSFASHQWAGPTHRAAACLLDPTGRIVGEGERNCPSSSKPFRQVQDRRTQPPCVVDRARGPALEGQLPLGSQALASLGLLSSRES